MSKTGPLKAELEARVNQLEAAIRTHREDVQRLFGLDYGTAEGESSADALLWKVLEESE